MTLLSDVIGIADGITRDLGLQGSVNHEVCTLLDGAGARSYAAPVSRGAIVEKKQKLVKTTNGEMEMSQASITFLSPTPVGMFDRLTLADGTTGPILNTGGFVDSSNVAILNEIYLG